MTYPAGYESSEWRRKKKKERKKHDETPARFIVHHQQIAGQSLMKPWWIYGSRKLHKCLIKLFWKWRSRSHGVRFSLFISTVDTIHHVQRVDLKSSISFSEVALFILTAFASGGVSSEHVLQQQTSSVWPNWHRKSKWRHDWTKYVLWLF